MTGLSGMNLIINPGNIIVQTDSRGFWIINSLPTGNYTITADTSSPKTPVKLKFKFL